ILRVNDPGGTPTLTTLTVVVPLTSTPLAQVAEGSVPLDIGDDRIVQAVVHKNKITGAVSLYTAQTVAVDFTGAVTPNGNMGADRDAIRWCEIGDLTGTPTLIQSG